jgi:hypothetical protein
MKFIFTSALCLCAVLLLSGQQTRAQSVPEKPTIVDFFPFDVYGAISSGDERARLDNLATQLLKDPEQVAYIFVYAGRRPCADESRAKIARIKNHFVKTLGIKPERVILQDGGYRDELTVELWLWRRTIEFSPPSATPHVAPGEVRMKNCKPASRPRRRRRDGRRQ